MPEDIMTMARMSVEHSYSVTCTLLTSASDSAVSIDFGIPHPLLTAAVSFSRKKVQHCIVSSANICSGSSCLRLVSWYFLTGFGGENHKRLSS